MNKIKVNLGKRSYQIIIGNNILTSLGGILKKAKLGTDAFIITNNLLKNKYGKGLVRSLAKAGIGFCFNVIADTEKSKSIQTASKVISQLAKFDKKKKVFIIAFGGGVVGDLAGFVASIYKRGIKYVQVPTTLLAQVDSSIGGKTAVDLALGKNLVGAFYQPALVFSDTALLSSLSKEQFSSGMAEVIKYAVIKDAKLFNFLKNNHAQIIKGNPAALKKIISSCCSIKAKIVSCDERETRGLRTILNFGHTFGHAIEAAGGYRGYNHGQAVALGMIAAANLSNRLGLLKQEDALAIKNLIRLYNLEVKLKGLSLDKIIKAHYRDKKFSGSQNRFVLIPAIGTARIICNIRLDLIKEAIRSIS